MGTEFNLTRKGFTLIELLVVISIIGLLASVVLSSVSLARAKGRDAARVQEVDQIKNALELYYSTEKHYPISTNGRETITGLVETGGPINGYIKSIPSNLFDGSGLPKSQYISSSDGSSYELVYQTETAGYAKSIGCNTETADAFKVANEGFAGAGCVAMNVRVEGDGGTVTGIPTIASFSLAMEHAGQSSRVKASWIGENIAYCYISDDSESGDHVFDSTHKYYSSPALSDGSLDVGSGLNAVYITCYNSLGTSATYDGDVVGITNSNVGGE